MAAPDYSAMEKYKPYSDASSTDDGAGDSPKPLSSTLSMLAEKFGFDEEKAQALWDFVKECMTEEESDPNDAQDDTSEGE